jgi:predicted CopG family antitoxin
MPTKSIELSDKIYEKLRAMKSKDESWDEFMARLIETVSLIHPSKSEWKKAYKKAFEDHKEVFQKLAE